MTTAIRRANKLSDQRIRYISEKSIVIAGKSYNKKTLAFIETLKLDYATKSFRQLARREAYDIVNKGNGIFKRYGQAYKRKPVRSIARGCGIPRDAIRQRYIYKLGQSCHKRGQEKIHQTHENRQRLTHSASAQTKTFACCSSRRHCPASEK